MTELPEHYSHDYKETPAVNGCELVFMRLLLPSVIAAAIFAFWMFNQIW